MKVGADFFWIPVSHRNSAFLISPHGWERERQKSRSRMAESSVSLFALRPWFCQLRWCLLYLSCAKGKQCMKSIRNCLIYLFWCHVQLLSETRVFVVFLLLQFLFFLFSHTWASLFWHSCKLWEIVLTTAPSQLLWFFLKKSRHGGCEARSGG